MDCFLAVIALVIPFVTYVSIFLIGTEVYPEFLYGVKWWLYYIAILYIPIVFLISGTITLFIHERIDDYYPHKHILWSTVNMIVTVILTIISVMYSFFVNQFILLTMFSIEICVIAFCYDVKKLIKIHSNGDDVFYMTNTEPKPYNGIFDYNTSKELIISDLTNIVHHRETPELCLSVNNGMKSLLHRLSNGEYFLADEDVKKIKSELLTIYGGHPNDNFYHYQTELYELIKVLYLLERTKTY